MRFVETPLFTSQVTDLLPDEVYRELQVALLLRPAAGKLVPGSGGIRKLRWRSEGRGKRGGVRLLYYLHTQDGVIYMLLIYSKAHREDVTQQQLRTLQRVVKENLEWTRNSSTS